MFALVRGVIFLCFADLCRLGIATHQKSTERTRIIYLARGYFLFLRESFFLFFFACLLGIVTHQAGTERTIRAFRAGRDCVFCELVFLFFGRVCRLVLASHPSITERTRIVLYRVAFFLVSRFFFFPRLLAGKY